MSTTLTPPPVVPSGPAPGAPAPRRESARVISILSIVAGGVLIAGVVGGGVLATVRMAGADSARHTASADGIGSLDLDVSAGTLTVAYDDVAEATLEVEGNTAGDWNLTRIGDGLSVTSQRDWWRGWSLFGFGTRGDEAVLTLPERLSETALDADLHVSAGEIVADGTYGRLDLDLSAGAVTVSGTADALTAGVSAGRATIDLDAVRTADIDISAGSLDGRITGTQPTSTTVEVSAGRVDLTLPRGDYALSSDVSAGDFSHRLSTDPASPYRVSVGVSAGAVRLAEQR